MLSHSQSSRITRHDPIVAIALLAVATILCGSMAKAQSNNVSSTQQVAKSAGNPAEVSSGKTTFEQRCAICHYAESPAQKIGPGLAGLYTRRKLADGKRVDDANLARGIQSGGKNMPGFKDALKPNQIRDLIAYLKTL
jgi:mono/diheme cytochrome c family protein